MSARACLSNYGMRTGVYASQRFGVYQLDPTVTQATWAGAFADLFVSVGYFGTYIRAVFPFLCFADLLTRVLPPPAP